MRSIKFNNERTYLRNNIKKIEIDDSNIVFINGVSVVDAKVSCFYLEYTGAGYRPRNEVYFCSGLINENYEEALSAKFNNDLEKYLIFSKENQKITRYGENDFIIERKEKNEMITHYVHIHYDGKSIYQVLDTKECITKTSISNLAIYNNQFYIVNANKFIGPKFKILKEDSQNSGEFIVIDKIVIPKEISSDYNVIDVLSFKMDKDFNVISVINSVIDGRSLYYNTTNYLEIRKQRIEELIKMVNSFQKNTTDLEEVRTR